MKWGVIVALGLSGLGADAAMPASEMSSMDIAAQALALKHRASPVPSLNPKGYHAGDEWEVAAWQRRPDLSGVRDPRLKRGRVGIFRYQVISVAPDQVKLRIKPLSAFGVATADSRVQEVDLTIRPDLTLQAKAYRMRDHADALPASISGIHSKLTPIEFFPLDAPDFRRAQASTKEASFVIPEPLQAIARQASFSSDPANLRGFEMIDVFGRPIDVYWKIGDPWPKWMDTPQGIAILLSVKRGG